MMQRVRAIANIAGAIIKTSQKKNVTDLQLKYGALHEKRIRIVFADIDRAMFIQVKSGRLLVEPNGDAFDLQARMTSDTMLNVFAKRMKRWNSKTRMVEFLPYNFIDAFRYGDIELEGESATNDFRLFLEIFDDHVDEINHVVRGETTLDGKPSQQDTNLLQDASG